MIQSKKPENPLNKFKIGIGGFIVFSVYGLIRYGLSGALYPLLIGLLVVLIFLSISELYDKRFDGWEINDESILLSRISMFGQVDKRVINLNKINSILYVKPAARRPLSFIFKTNKKTLTLMPSMDIYKFGATLKHLKDKGIKIDFFESDHEIELYLNDRIDSIPMTNDMKIKN